MTQSGEIGMSKMDSDLFVLSRECPSGFTSLASSNVLHLCPYVHVKAVNSNKGNRFDVAVPLLNQWQCKHVDFASFPWKFIPIKAGSSYQLTPAMQVLDIGYNSGHVFYRVTFNMTGKSASLDLNIRHRVTLFLNNEAIGGHLTYSLHLFRPGSKFGPDAASRGWKRYTLPPHLLNHSNTLIIQIENLGYNRQAFLFNDVKNPRGLLDARLVPGKASSISDILLDIAGVDTRTLDNVYLTSGFPDEHDESDYSLVAINTPLSMNDPKPMQHNCLAVPTQSTPIWYKTTFVSPDNGYEFPLRVHLTGRCTCYIWINNVLVGRYYGNGDGPQKDFYIMQGLLTPLNTLKLVCYDGRVGEEMNDGVKDQLRVSLMAWNVALDEGDWSGNLCVKGDHYVLKKGLFVV